MPLLGRRAHKKSHKKDKKHSGKKTLRQRIRNRLTKKKVDPKTDPIEKLKTKKHLRERAKHLQLTHAVLAQMVTDCDKNMSDMQKKLQNYKSVTKKLKNYEANEIKLRAENQQLKSKLAELMGKTPPVPPRKPVDSVEEFGSPQDSKKDDDNSMGVQSTSETLPSKSYSGLNSSDFKSIPDNQDGNYIEVQPADSPNDPTSNNNTADSGLGSSVIEELPDSGLGSSVSENLPPVNTPDSGFVSPSSGNLPDSGLNTTNS